MGLALVRRFSRHPRRCVGRTEKLPSDDVELINSARSSLSHDETNSISSLTSSSTPRLEWQRQRRSASRQLVAQRERERLDAEHTAPDNDDSPLPSPQFPNCLDTSDGPNVWRASLSASVAVRIGDTFPSSPILSFFLSDGQHVYLYIQKWKDNGLFFFCWWTAGHRKEEEKKSFQDDGVAKVKRGVAE